MGHCINIYIGKKEEMNDPLIEHLELDHGIVAILDWPKNELPGRNEDTKLLEGRSIARITTDYFGGFGDQSAILYIDGKIAYEGDTCEGDSEPINNALRFMGVVAQDDMDEFDAVGLGKYRSNQDFSEENDEDLNLGEDDPEIEESRYLDSALASRNWTTEEVIVFINDFWETGLSMTEYEKNKWIQKNILGK